jgi:hypothetical protein
MMAYLPSGESAIASPVFATVKVPACGSGDISGWGYGFHCHFLRLSLDVFSLSTSGYVLYGYCGLEQCSTRSVPSSPRSEPNWITFRRPVYGEDQNWQSLRRDELDRLHSTAVDHVRR